MFGKAIDLEILGYVKSFPDIETGGYISADRKFVPVRNTSTIPTEEYLPSQHEIPDDALAFVHSHQGGPFYPSETDMQQQIATGIPWGIAAFDDNYSEVFWLGNDVPRAPLVGRGFRHGVTDCYSLIRDFYKEIHGIELPEYPRDWEWWQQKKSLYLDGFKAAGFREIPVDEILPGDVFLATIKADSPNHAGVFLGNGLILHHSAGRFGCDPSRLSTVEPANRLFHFLTKVLRHENNNIDRAIGQRIRF